MRALARDEADKLSELSEAHGRGARDLLDGIRWQIRLRWISTITLALAIPGIWVCVTLVPHIPSFAEVGGRPFPLPAKAQVNVRYDVLVAFAVIVGLLNGAYAWALRHLQRAPESAQASRAASLLVHVQVTLDVLTITVLCYFFGSFETPLPLYVIFHMIAAASVLTPKRAYLHTAIAFVCFALLANFEYYGILPHQVLIEANRSGGHHLHPDYLSIYMTVMLTLLVATVFLVNHLSAKVQAKQEQLKTRALELSTFYNTVRVISGSVDLETTLRQVMRQFTKVYAVDHYSLHLVDEATGKIHVHSSHGNVVAPINPKALGLGTELIPASGEDGAGAVVPLHARDRVVGALQVFKPVGHALSAMEVELLETLCANLALAALNASLFGSVEREAMTDGLTGLMNHRHFYRRLTEELGRARRHKRELTLILLDIDHFKLFNDRFGHMAGDQVLREVAKLVLAQVRHNDVVARYGGEELAILLIETSAGTGAEIAERIRRTLDETRLSDALPRAARHVTASLGVATWREHGNGAGSSAEDLVERADAALYRAKAQGRNFVVVDTGPGSGEP